MMDMAEQNDPFAGSTDVGIDDPFAGSDEDFAGFGEDTPVPVVDREGQPVDGGEHYADEARRAEDAYQYSLERGEPISDEQQARHDAYVAEQPQATDEPTQQAPVEEPASEPVSGAAEEVEAVNPEGTPVETPELPEETPEQVAAPTEVRAAAENGLGAAEAAGADQGGTDPAVEDENAEEPKEVKDKSGKTTKRRYVILRVIAEGEFEQASWYEKDGEVTATRVPGAKRQRVLLARGTEDALARAYVALGAPQSGLTLVAVAALHFQPKRVAPKAQQPTRMRLEIS